MTTAFIFQLIMLPFIICAIIKNSNIKIYRLYLLNGITSNTLLMISFELSSMVSLGVYPAFMADSPFVKWFQPGFQYTLVEFFTFSAVNNALALTLSASYRIIHLLNLNWKILKLADKPWFLLLMDGVIQIPSIGLIYLMFESRREYELSKESYKSILEEAPMLESFFQEKIIFGKRRISFSICPVM